MGVFGYNNNHYYQPAYVFTAQLGSGNAKYTAEAVSIHALGAKEPCGQEEPATGRVHCSCCRPGVTSPTQWP